jgi:hypothetical protein
MKIDFTFETKHGVYRDALYLDDDHSFTEQEIEVMKQERVDNWIAVIESPPAEEVQDIIEINDMQYKKIEIDEQIVLKPTGD